MKFAYLDFDCHKNYRLYLTNLLSIGLEDKCVEGCNENRNVDAPI